MSSEHERDPKNPAAPDEDAGDDDTAVAAPIRRHRLILPLGMRVLVSLIKEEDRTGSGLYLPQGAKEAQDEALYGEVVEVARDKPTTDHVAENVSGVPHGARVLFKKGAGIRVPWDERLRLLDVKDILATVEELSDDEAH